MARALSLDLRKRVVEASDTGLSTREAARRVFDRDFDVRCVVSGLALERPSGAWPAGQAEAFKAGRARSLHSQLG